MMPVMGHATLESVHAAGQRRRGRSSISAPIEMEANAEACEASVEKSLSMVTSLNPHIGYEKAAALAKEAFKTRQDDSRAVPRAEASCPKTRSARPSTR